MHAGVTKDSLIKKPHTLGRGSPVRKKSAYPLELKDEKENYNP
jgi:hypothetical protein